MADDPKDHQIDQLLRDGEDVMMSATLLPPSCHLCGNELNHYYIEPTLHRSGEVHGVYHRASALSQKDGQRT